MSITKQDQQELEQIFSDYRESYKGCKEDYFAAMYLMNKFEAPMSELSSRIAFGGNDFGLDAYYFDRSTKNLYLYQFKWSESYNLFKESLDRLSKSGMSRIFGNPLTDPSANELLNNLRADLKEYKSAVKQVYIQFVFKGDLDAAEESEGLRSRRENLENKIHLIHSYFENEDIELTVEFISDRRQAPKVKAAENHKINFGNSVPVSTADNKRNMHIGFMPLMDLYRIYKSLEQRFLDRNIRFGLNSENSPNTKIREALMDIVIKEKYEPDLFCFNHNGVTLAAEDLIIEEEYAIIKVPRLLNGAQTVTSVAKFLSDNEGNPSLVKNNDKLEQIKVLAKIIVDDPFSSFVTNITICNNRQNPVEPWTLRANDKIQCDLFDELKKAKIFYERQDNAFRNYSISELEDQDIDGSRPMRIRPLAQTFLAVQGEIGKMSLLPDVFENQKTYEETFKDTYLQCDMRKIVLAYKIHLVLKDPIERLKERSSQKHANTISKARNLVWALLIQAILNDNKLPDMLDDFGTSLKKETAFREYLKTLASAKLLPIFKELFAIEQYKDRILEERYEFLRTKEVFNACKSIAADKHGWTKKSF